MDIKRLRALISQHEGIRYSAYKDTEGNSTIGIGFNLNTPQAKAICEGFGIDYDAILTGNTPLTQDQVMQLFDYSIDLAFADAHAACPNFDSLCAGAQLALCDMAFNLGQSRLREFKHMLAALAVKDYDTAATQMADSIWAGQVPNRS